MSEVQQAPILTVSDANRAVRDVIEGSYGPFWLAGEVGSLIVHTSGHVYFTLKDKASQIKACWFGGAQQCRQMGIANGSLVEAFGKLTVYEVRGEYQFSARTMRLAGVGNLQQEFDAVKAKLEAEGLFSLERKKRIPLLPRKIGVVTSPSGAAIKDFLQIISRRFPNVNIRIYPCLVQGEQAAAQVAAGVAFFNRTKSCDVIVVTRGGGSMEDLWCFNDENLARSIAASTIPVISAVGHERDYTICDFAADLRAPTPSAAAELVISHHEELFNRLNQAEKSLKQDISLKFAHARTRLDRSCAILSRNTPDRRVLMLKQHIDDLDMRCSRIAEQRLNHVRTRLESMFASLYAQNPQRLLERGYAVVFDPATNKPVTSSNIAPDTLLSLRFADGSVAVKTLEKEL
jgi:exodeoxyribonuclease VII large subunit